MHAVSHPEPGWFKKIGHSIDKSWQKLRDGAIATAGPALGTLAVSKI